MFWGQIKVILNILWFRLRPFVWKLRPRLKVLLQLVDDLQVNSVNLLPRNEPPSSVPITYSEIMDTKTIYVRLLKYI